MKNSYLLAPCFVFAAAANAATLTFDFETANQFSDNFRVVRGTAGSNIGQTSTVGNDYMWGGMLSGTQNVVAVYDTTPLNSSDAAQTFGNSFTVDFMAASANGAQVVGVYLIDPTNSSNNLSARVSINQNGAADYFTFGRDGNLTTGSGGTAFIQKGAEDTTGIIGLGGYFQNTTTYRANTPLANSSESTPVFHPLRITYTYGDNDTTMLTFAYGDGSSYSASVILSDDDRIANPALGFYISQYTVNTTTKIDDIVVTYTTVPEPSNAALLLGGVAGCVFAFKRKRRA